MTRAVTAGLVTLASAAALAGVLYASYAPIGSWWLLLPALTIAIRFASFRRGWLFGTLFMLGSLMWAIVPAVEHLGAALVPVALILGILEALPFAIAGWAFARTKNRSPLAFCLGVPASYALLEAARASGPLGVPLAMLGTTQTKGPFAVLFTYGGTPLVTFVVVAICATIVYVANEMQHERFSPRARTVAIVSTLLFAIALGGANGLWYGALHSRYGGPAARVGIVEAGPIDVGRSFASTARDYAAMTQTLPKKDIDFALWPEGIFFFNRPDANEQRRIAANAGRSFGHPILAGATLRENGSLQNVLLQIDPSGRFESVYRKRRLVPFGEYRPFANGGTQRDGYGTGAADEKTLVRAGSAAPFGALVCYEVAFSDLTSGSANEGAHFLVAVLNDTWFAGTDGPAQLAQLASARAIESGIAIVRADAVPPSGAVDADGTSLGELRHDGALAVNVPGGIVTPYRRIGKIPWFASIPWFAIAIVPLWPALRSPLSSKRRSVKSAL